jgi:sigma-B regulation protein RsbU (phosphoserine phosphatase)
MSQDEILRRQLDRERAARRQAEELLEAKSRELYEANRELEARRASLEQAVEERTAELTESEARIRAILEGAVDGIITIDSAGRIDSFNAAASAIFGHSPDEIVGCNVNLLMPQPYRSQHDGFIERYLDGGEPRMVGIGRETVGVRKDGTEFPMYLSVSEVVFGERRMFTGIVHDLSEQKKTELALAKSREREGKVGGRIQQALLFGQPPRDMMGLEVAALTIPSQSIDGDFIDFYRNDDMCVDILIGDVMGKGVLAALVGAGTKTNFLRALNKLVTGTRLPRPVSIVGAVDSILTPQLMELETFVTLLYARVSRATGKVEFVDCGHTGLMHYSVSTGQCTVTDGYNLPLGIIEGEIFRQVEVDVEIGDVLLLYSDGITEAQSPSGELYGEDRLLECVCHHRTLDADELVATIRAAVVEFSGAEQFADDFTCIAIKIQAPLAEIASPSRELKLTSDTNELRRVRAFIGQAVAEIDVEDTGFGAELVTAVNETVTNIMRHAYLGQPDKPIRIQVEIYPTEIAVRISHRGIGLKRHSLPSPSLDGTEDGGFGLYLVDRMIDRIAYYENAAGDDCIILVKKVPER